MVLGRKKITADEDPRKGGETGGAARYPRPLLLLSARESASSRLGVTAPGSPEPPERQGKATSLSSQPPPPPPQQSRLRLTNLKLFPHRLVPPPRVSSRGLGG